MQLILDFTPAREEDWTLRESAMYKLNARGLLGVSDLELLATLIGNQQTAKGVMEYFGSLRRISSASMIEIQQVKGVGKKIAGVIVSAFELARRKNYEAYQSFKAKNSQEVARYIHAKYADHQQEAFSVLFLNQAHKLIAHEELFKGGVSAVVVDPKVIFKRAILHMASAIIITHNHPSTNLKPSQHDIVVTQKILAGARLFDISLLDHIIIGPQSDKYYSFADNGKL